MRPKTMSTSLVLLKISITLLWCCTIVGAARASRLPTTKAFSMSQSCSRSTPSRSIIWTKHVKATSAKSEAPQSLGATTAALTSRQRQLLNFFSGGVAGTIASMLTSPLEVVKTQLQSSIASKAARGELAAEAGHPLAVAKAILARDGVRGFYRGMRPTLVGIIPARSAYFYAYQQCKRKLAKWAVPHPSGLLLAEGSVANSIVSGLFAGVAANTLTNPIWMVKTRMQILADGKAGQRVYKSYGEVISTIAKEEGIGGFYKGICASYWGCAEGCVQFVLYEKFKQRLILRQNERRKRMGVKEETDELPPLVYFMAAAVAKGVASIATYPHEVARTRLREQARDGLFQYSGMWQTLGLVAKQEGWKGLYGGMGIHLLKVVPNSAIMFLTYEICNSYLDRFQVVDVTRG